MTIPSQFLFGISLPILVKYIGRSIDNHMANWKVIETVSGNIEAVSGLAATPAREHTSSLSGKEKPRTKLKPSMCRESRSQGRPGVDAHSPREGS